MLKRFGVVAVLVMTVAFAALRVRGDDDAKKAEAQKPVAVHQVITNKLGEKRYEIWTVPGVGSRGEGWRDDKRAIAAFGGEEKLTIATGKRSYSLSKAQNLVEVTSSVPSRASASKNGVSVHNTGSGNLESYVKDRERNAMHYRKCEITVTEEVRDGRKVQRVLVVRDMGNVVNGDGLYEDEFLSDIATDRIFWNQSRRFPSGSVLTVKTEYLDADKVDKSLFKFAIPKGATVRAWVPLKVDDDPKVETCIVRLRTLASGLTAYDDFRREVPSAMLARVVSGATKYGSDPDLQWCPADPRKGVAGYTSYAIANDTPTGRLASPEGTVVLECRHHGPKLIVACGDGHVQINPK